MYRFPACIVYAPNIGLYFIYFSNLKIIHKIILFYLITVIYTKRKQFLGSFKVLKQQNLLKYQVRWNQTG